MVTGENGKAFDFNEAEAACKAKGTTLASKHQLLAAFTAGYDNCKCGWISDRYKVLPIQEAKMHCYKFIPAGLSTCYWINNPDWGAYCVKKNQGSSQIAHGNIYLKMKGATSHVAPEMIK